MDAYFLFFLPFLLLYVCNFCFDKKKHLLHDKGFPEHLFSFIPFGADLLKTHRLFTLQGK